ncbi:MAG: DegT/DnrJ/EryC1/StrS family aminotransferase [Candidatus Puniceispirillaceae bacterium]
MKFNNKISGWPSFSQDEISVVQNVLGSNKVNYWTGEECKKFETEFALWLGCKHAVAVMNGTVAIEVALKAIGISFGDEVIVTPRSFFASVSPVVAVGAKPVFADVQLNSGNICPNSITKLITRNTKAIICVHLAGWPCDMDEIMQIAKDNNIMVIEDCAQAHGAKYKGKNVGTIGDLGTWSFCQDKIITTGGEGGMVTCNDKTLMKALWSFKDHGKDFDLTRNLTAGNQFKWLHVAFGTNLRMTEMQAAIGRVQLKKLNEWTSLRTQNAQAIIEAFSEFSRETPLIRQPEFQCSSCTCGRVDKGSGGLTKPSGSLETNGSCTHAYYKLYVYLELQNLKVGWTRERIIDELMVKGVPCSIGSCPEIYLEKAFSGSTSGRIARQKNAMELGETSLMFLVHPSLTNDDIMLMKNAIRSVFTNALKA